MAVPLLLSLVLLAPHPGSLSRSLVTVEGSELRHALRVQALTLIETLPIDTSGDLVLDEAELEGARGSLEVYLREHYRFFAGGFDGAQLQGRLTELELRFEGGFPMPGSFWVEAAFEYASEQPLEALALETTLFEESNPQHLEYLSVTWSGEAPQHHVFGAGDRRRSFAPTGLVQKGRLRAFLELGTLHILSGFDHLLFLIALLVAVRDLRSLAWVVTAFTLAHSITLGLAALEVVSLPPRFVELAIALSIVYVAAENLLRLEKRSLWLEAFGFGLLHGLGFAAFLGEALQAEDSIVVPLIGFNLGVELGQLLVVGPLALVFALFARRGRAGQQSSPAARELLVPAAAGRLASIAIVAVGSFWFAERAGVLG
jgi:hypothetical protein